MASTGAESTRVRPDWGVSPSDEDFAQLERSWINREIAEQALLRRVDSEEGRQIVGQKGKRDCAGLLIPYYLPGEPHAHSYRIRRDNPEFEYGKDGNPKPKAKYLTAPGGGNRLYFPTGVTQEQLADRSIPIVITEGEKKALSLWRLAFHQSMDPRFIPVAIPGVWNWRGTVGKALGPSGERIDVKGPINDLHWICWDDRKVFIVFDANVASNNTVMAARSGLAFELTKRHSAVELVDLPPGCGVNGVDDLLASAGPEKVLSLFETATPARRLEIVTSPQFQSRPEGMIRVTARGEQFVETQLSNFTAEITKSIRLDDGVETSFEFEVLCGMMGSTSRFTISASQFGRMEWPIEKLGQAAIVYPNQREYARTAIQSASLSANVEHVYTHTGWRKIDGSWRYLHSGGAIGASGACPGLNVRLPGPLSRYQLDLPSGPQELIEAIRQTLLLPKLAPPPVAFPLLAATVLSTLIEADFSLHLVGETGAFKSELAALIQQFFGAGMTRSNLPASWSSTGNSLEALCFQAKDALVVIDDFAPQGGASEISRYHSTAERVFRAAGNRSARGRLDSSARLRETKPPRALILSTGEDVPRGHSVRARLLILELAKGDINSAKLSECQRAAASGIYSRVMAGFIQHVAGRLEETKRQIDLRRAELRHRTVSASHARTPDIVTSLQAAFEVLLEFALVVGAVDDDQVQMLSDACWDALATVAKAQGSHQATAEPAERFLLLLRSCLSSGRAHLAAPKGGAPENSPESCGWRQNGGDGWSACGERVGWVDQQNIYLDMAASYRVANRAGQDTNEGIPVTEPILKKRLNEKGLLASTDKGRGVLTIRKTLSGSQKEVLRFSRTTILPRDEEGENVGF